MKKQAESMSHRELEAFLADRNKDIKDCVDALCLSISSRKPPSFNLKIHAKICRLRRTQEEIAVASGKIPDSILNLVTQKEKQKYINIWGKGNEQA